MAVPPAAGGAVFYRHFRLFCRILPGSFLCLSRSSSLGVFFAVLRVGLRRLLGLGSVVLFDFCSWCSNFWCCDCDACWSWWSACSRCCAWRAWSYAAFRWISSLVGVSVARPVVGSTGETCHRWRFPSPVASSRRPGSSTGLPVCSDRILTCRIKSICSPAKGGTGCYRFNYQPGS